ncbi:hypothetical protein BU17DRAFT_73253 [Hysterangium stoloniferum]|nr:hypothetical protein BU17DRAFT_73253 [Hysterangium stoloniferum]
MKLLGKHVEKDGTGYVIVRPEDDEDMWHLFNLIQEGDEVRAPAIRRIINTSATGSVESHRIRLSLTLQVTRVHFSPAASTSNKTAGDAPAQATAMLQIAGRVTSENQHVKLGAFHTLDIEANRNVRIIKEDWDSMALERVTEACVEGRGAEVGAIVCGEGVAALCVVSEHMTVIRQRIEVPIPRKRTGSTSMHEKGLERFYSTLYASFLRHIPFGSLRVVVIASPGFVKDAVYDYIFTQALKTNNKPLTQAKNKFIRVHVNSPHVHSLVDVLKSPEVASQLKETKFAREGIMLDKFFKMLGTDEDRAWYGADHVELAEQRGAIGTLLISDELFRSSDPVQRKRFIRIVEGVREKGGEVLIFSSMHESGQQLNQLTGIAAILTFPLDVEMVEAEEREGKAKEEGILAEESDESNNI